MRTRDSSSLQQQLVPRPPGNKPILPLLLRMVHRINLKLILHKTPPFKTAFSSRFFSGLNLRWHERGSFFLAPPRRASAPRAARPSAAPAAAGIGTRSCRNEGSVLRKCEVSLRLSRAGLGKLITFMKVLQQAAKKDRIPYQRKRWLPTWSPSIGGPLRMRGR